MKISFRQGIVSYQTIGGIPDFLDVQSLGGGNNKVNLKTSNAPTIVAFAHGQADYLYIEPQQALTTGWAGPFATGIDYWLYWDINKNTGHRTFGFTLLPPTFGPHAPHAPGNDQHWFDTITYQMKVWHATAWVVVIRVFAAHLVSGGTSFTPNATGTQVGLSGINIDAGQILFGNDGNAVKKNTGSFFTASEQFYAGGSSITALSPDLSTVLNFFAVENIAQFHVVKVVGENQVGVAAYSDSYDSLLGVAMSDAIATESVTVLMQGAITNPTWTWTAGSKLWVTTGGLLTDTDPGFYNPSLPPQSFVARAISSTTIMFMQTIGQKGDPGIGAPTIIAATPNSVIAQTIWIPAGAMYSSVYPLTGVVPGTAIVARNYSGGNELRIPQVISTDFFVGTSLQFTVSFPGDWNPSTVKFAAMWMLMSPTSSIVGTRVRFQLEAITMIDGQVLSVPYGPPILVERHVPSPVGYAQYKTPESATMTVTGTPEVNGVTYFRLTRVVSTTDDFVSPVTLIGINLQYSTTLGSTADVTPPAP
jgi:hypothetical protein